MHASIAGRPVGIWMVLCISPPTSTLHKRTQRVSDTSNWAPSPHHKLSGSSIKRGVKRKSLNILHFSIKTKWTYTSGFVSVCTNGDANSDTKLVGVYTSGWKGGASLFSAWCKVTVKRDPLLEGTPTTTHVWENGTILEAGGKYFDPPPPPSAAAPALSNVI